MARKKPPTLPSEIAAALGAAGGEARARNMTAEDRSAAARSAVQERWRKWRERKAAEEAANAGR